MTITSNILSNTDFQPLIDCGEDWNRHARNLEEMAAEVDSVRRKTISEDVFDGNSATESRKRLAEVVFDYEDSSLGAKNIARLITDNGNELVQCQEELATLKEKLPYDGMYIDERDKITNIVELEDGKLPDGRDYQDVRAQHAPVLSDILQRAERANDQIRKRIFSEGDAGNWRPGPGEDTERFFEERFKDLIEGVTNPEEVSEQWGLLPEEIQNEILVNNPEDLAWLDGIPSDVRHEANMSLLEDHVSQNPDDTDAKNLLRDVESDGLFLLGFEPPPQVVNMDEMDEDLSSEWKVVTATGNPDEADNLAIFVPGTESDVSYENTRTQIDRSAALADQSNSEDSSSNTVSIMWQGYDAPNNVEPSWEHPVPEALSADHAENAGADLNSFTTGIDVNNNDARTTVIGHSYGSTVVAYADQSGNGMATDAVVLAGSPGPAGSGIEQASDFNVGEENVFLAMSDGDPIANLAGHYHGADVTSPEFGGVQIDSGRGDHGGYWGEDSDALNNQAHIINGHIGNVNK